MHLNSKISKFLLFNSWYIICCWLNHVYFHFVFFLSLSSHLQYYLDTKLKKSLTLSENQAYSHKQLAKTELVKNCTDTLAPEHLPILPKRCLHRDWIRKHVLCEGPRPGLNRVCFTCTILWYLCSFCCLLCGLGLVDLPIADSSHFT